MHPRLQERAAVLADMRARTFIATTEFYEKIGRPAPPQGPRFQAVAKGKAWHVIEISTGLTKGFCFSHRAAMRFVDAMEAGVASKRGALQ
ncbi:hypothetical protein HU720_05370 [Pseudomonas sp. SWRI51]|uniref:hypothetical protein n=1 Tax=Pseudomonas sp. SWRI51 TaxID=2745491 RepID=UPI00164922C7|nr:hypothetical protein [Pseudomonas sp. SWRI51]MBC3410727.1 hypothetical protein [Pseudomonas sp. SWRI51]